MIDGQELEHLGKSLRLVPGDHITVFDDSGWEHDAIILTLSSQRGEIELVRSYQAERESALKITLAVGLTKGEKMDLVVEKATELGVQNVIPFISAYTVPKLDQKKIRNRLERWQKIALSAAKQSGRTRIPEILAVYDFKELVKQSFPDNVKLLFWEREKEQTLNDVRREKGNARAVVIAVGPEGGFSAAEMNMARDNDFILVGLGPRILRAETAAMTAMSLVQFLWGDLG
jgi:16S rRNA (uracil1498-N3)-methyltransferase